MTTTVQCIKCGEEKPALTNPPFRAGTKLADLGLEIQQKVCAPCYRDWINMSVKLVNEMRLDTTDPRGQEIWLKQMKLFLNLEGAQDPWSRLLDKPVVLETTGNVRVRATLIGATPDALTLADFEGGAIPEGFAPSAGGAKGSATIPRDAVKTLEPAS